MHPRTIATIDELKKADWFCRVGVADTDSATVLSSWKDAAKSCKSRKWTDLCLEAANQLRERILERSRERFEQWNVVAKDCRKVAIPLVRRKLRPHILKHSLPNDVEGAVSWDIIHLCIEAEYADVVSPAFFASQGYWYVNGHFPCGWKGDFPDGKLVIY